MGKFILRLECKEYAVGTYKNVNSILFRDAFGSKIDPSIYDQYLLWIWVENKALPNTFTLIILQLILLPFTQNNYQKFIGK